MSVIEYIYPTELSSLNRDSLLSALQAALPGIVVAEIETVPRQTLKWSSVLLGHPRSSKCATLLVCDQNTASNVTEKRARYRGNRNLPAVERASILLWSQLKLSKNASDAAVFRAIDTHNAVLETLLRLSRGAIDLPENEKLYSAVGFSRHLRVIRLKRLSR